MKKQKFTESQIVNAIKGGLTTCNCKKTDQTRAPGLEPIAVMPV